MGALSFIAIAADEIWKAPRESRLRRLCMFGLTALAVTGFLMILYPTVKATWTFAHAFFYAAVLSLGAIIFQSVMYFGFEVMKYLGLLRRTGYDTPWPTTRELLTEFQNFIVILCPSVWYVLANWESIAPKVVYEWNLFDFVFKNVAYMVLMDTMFFHTHRFMHENKYVYQKVHLFHHRHLKLSVFHTADTTWMEQVFTVMTPYLIIVIGVAKSSYINAYTVFFAPWWNLYLTTMGHAGFDTPFSSHEMHHRNPRKNYGLFFPFWDRFYETHKSMPHGLGDPYYGIEFADKTAVAAVKSPRENKSMQLPGPQAAELAASRIKGGFYGRSATLSTPLSPRTFVSSAPTTPTASYAAASSNTVFASSEVQKPPVAGRSISLSGDTMPFVTTYTPSVLDRNSTFSAVFDQLLDTAEKVKSSTLLQELMQLEDMGYFGYSAPSSSKATESAYVLPSPKASDKLSSHKSATFTRRPAQLRGASMSAIPSIAELA